MFIASIAVFEALAFELFLLFAKPMPPYGEKKLDLTSFFAESNYIRNCKRLHNKLITPFVNNLAKRDAHAKTIFC